MNDVEKFAKEGVFKILVGNKCDLEEKRQVSKIKGKQLADQYGIPFLETSAKNRDNIEELFVSSTQAYLDKQEKSGNSGFKQVKKNPNEAAINLSERKIEKNVKKKGCC